MRSEEIAMPAAHDSFDVQLRRIRGFAGRVSAALGVVLSHPGRLTTTDPRVAATATLLGMIIAAVATSAFPLQIAAKVEQVASTGMSKPDDAPASIKFIGSAPRGASCQDQVWPYIERHCLRRAADSPSIAGPGLSSRKGSENSKQRGTAE